MARNHPGYNTVEADTGDGRWQQDGDAAEGGGKRHLDGSGGQPTSKVTKLSMLALANILFFNVSGGPFGTEGLVRTGGPLFSIIGLIILPMMWSYPVGLMTAELSTAFPRDGGYVLWVEAAYGKRAAFHIGWWSWASSAIDTALYPVMFASFLQGTMGANFSPIFVSIVRFIFAAVVTLINLFGVDVVGKFSIGFGVAVLAPVVLLIAVCIPNIKPSNWLKPAPKTDLVAWVNLALWNLNGWDAGATIGDQVQDPVSTIPKALAFAMVLVIVPYVVTILAATGVDANFGSYHNGQFNEIAEQQGGAILGGLFALASVASAMGMYVSDVTTSSYMMSGMAVDGVIPSIFARRFPPHFDSPVIPILLVFAIVNVLLFLPFSRILEADNFLYSLQLLTEIAAFLQLRVSNPDLPRPFRVDLSTPWLCAMMVFPAFFALFQMFSSSLLTFGICTIIVSFGLVLDWANTRYFLDTNDRYSSIE